MLIALPNPDKSFTCTLFLPFEGERVCFENISDEKDLVGMFQTYFDDAFQLMPDLVGEYFRNHTSALINIECYPWMLKNAILIGDSSHAMVPFYGQGMNCGFEDCYVLDSLIEKLGTNVWELIFAKFQKMRKPNTDAISQLAMENFEEMRNEVADPKFLIRKKIEAKLHELYPKDWIPLVHHGHVFGYPLCRGICPREITEENHGQGHVQSIDYPKLEQTRLRGHCQPNG
jgi:kynurenine 3-monooxygenase